MCRVERCRQLRPPIHPTLWPLSWYLRVSLTSVRLRSCTLDCWMTWCAGLLCFVLGSFSQGGLLAALVCAQVESGEAGIAPLQFVLIFSAYSPLPRDVSAASVCAACNAARRNDAWFPLLVQCSQTAVKFVVYPALVVFARTGGNSTVQPPDTLPPCLGLVRQAGLNGRAC